MHTEDIISQASKDAMQQVTALAKALVAKAAEIHETETQLETLVEQYGTLEQEFALMGFNSLGLPSGEKIQVDQRVSASVISQQNFHQFAGGNELLYKLKDTLEMTFAGENREVLQQIMTILDEAGVVFDFKQAVHHSTLNSFVKKYIEQASDANEAIQTLAGNGLKVSQHNQIKIKSSANNNLLFKRRFKK